MIEFWSKTSKSYIIIAVEKKCNYVFLNYLNYLFENSNLILNLAFNKYFNKSRN